MKYYQHITEFRKEYRKLHYEKGQRKLWELHEWCIKWCEENKIDEEGCFLFMDLAITYANKDIAEKLLYS